MRRSRLPCDQSKGQAGDPCSGKTNACTPDGKAVLACHDGKLSQVALCPGESGCSVQPGKVDCDLGKGDDKHPRR